MSCVETTARQAFLRDYYVVFTGDCTATYDQADHEATLRNIDAYFGEKVADPYRWLEDENSPDTAKWVEEENKVTFGYLDTIPYPAWTAIGTTELALPGVRVEIRAIARL